MSKLTIFLGLSKAKTEAVNLAKFARAFAQTKHRSYNYKMKYRNLANRLEEFQERQGTVLMSDSFTENMTEEFIYFLKSVRNCRPATIKTFIGLIGVVVKRAEKEGYLVNDGYKDVELKTEDATSVYLTLAELDRINTVKLAPPSAAVRDRFLIGCYTALRYSDYNRITAMDLTSDYMQIKTQKTGSVVRLPIHPVIKDIVSRNNNVLPVMKSQQNFNKMIKVICRKAKVNALVTIERTQGIIVVRKRVKKYELISSHTARRTGATLLYLAKPKIETARIMLLTGHKTEEAFFKYIRIGKEENARELSEHPFFSHNFDKKTKVDDNP